MSHSHSHGGHSGGDHSQSHDNEHDHDHDHGGHGHSHGQTRAAAGTTAHTLSYPANLRFAGSDESFLSSLARVPSRHEVGDDHNCKCCDREEASLVGIASFFCVETRKINVYGRCGRRGCTESKLTGKKLKRCTRCLTMPYCSEACQKEDWEAHRGICTILKWPIDFAWSAVILPNNLRIDYTHMLRQDTCPQINFAAETDPGGRPTVRVTCTSATYGVDLNVGHALDDESACPRTPKSEMKKRRKGSDKRSVIFDTSNGTLFTGPSKQSCDCYGQNKLYEDEHARDVKFRFPELAALSEALGLKVYVWVRNKPLKKDQVVPCIPPFPEWMDNIPDEELERQTKYDQVDYPDTNVKYLRRTLLPAPCTADKGAKPFMHERMSQPSGTTPAPTYFESVLRIPNRHPGPFFALPGDQIVTMILCASTHGPLGCNYHPLGLGHGKFVATVEFNTATGIVRMLARDGWQIIEVPIEILDLGGYLEAAGPLCPKCCKTEGPNGWKWAHGRRLWKLRLERYGWASACYCDGHPARPWRPVYIPENQVSATDPLEHMQFVPEYKLYIRKRAPDEEGLCDCGCRRPLSQVLGMEANRTWDGGERGQEEADLPLENLQLDDQN